MDNILKFFKALETLKLNTECSFSGEITNEQDYNKIQL